MGMKQDRVFQKNPQLRQLWEEYVLCRNQEFVVFRRPEKGGKSEKQITAIWTTGFAQLPDEGGLRDQNYLTLRIFTAFLEGEHQGQIRRMQK